MQSIDPPIEKQELEAFGLKLNELMGEACKGSVYRGLTLTAGAFAVLLETYAKPNDENPQGMCDDVPAFCRHFAGIVAHGTSPIAAMTAERFNELLNGPLSHPMPMFAITRLALALRDVVFLTGEAGAQALEDHCGARQQRDDSQSEQLDGE